MPPRADPTATHVATPLALSHCVTAIINAMVIAARWRLKGTRNQKECLRGDTDATRMNMRPLNTTPAATSARDRPIFSLRNATIQPEASTLVAASGMTSLS